MYHCKIVFIVSVEKSSQKRVLRVSSEGSKHFETIKALGRFICFSVFGTPDETLTFVFDILLSFTKKSINLVLDHACLLGEMLLSIYI